MNKRLKLALFAVVAAVAVSVCSPKVRTWASVEGSYLYNQLVVRGPVYIFASKISGAQGIVISTSAYTGSSQTGVPTAGAGTALWLFGGETSAARTACGSTVEGQHIYDSTVHSLAFCDGTVWHKLVTGSGTNDYWTTY